MIEDRRAKIYELDESSSFIMHSSSFIFVNLRRKLSAVEYSWVQYTVLASRSKVGG